MLGGVPHQGRLPGQPVRVIRLGGVSFLHVKAAKWGNPHNWVIKSLQHGKLFRQLHLQNWQNTDEIDSAGDNLGVESDSQANQLNQTKFLPATTTLKQKVASSEQTIVLCLCAFLVTK